MLEFPQYGDDRGHLVIVEAYKDTPFDIKRVFYMNVEIAKIITTKAAEINIPRAKYQRLVDFPFASLKISK